MTNAETRTRTVTWADPLERISEVASMSGLEYMSAVVGGKLPPPPIMVTMGITGGEAEEGRVVFRGEAGEYLYNPIGVVHASSTCLVIAK